MCRVRMSVVRPGPLVIFDCDGVLVDSERLIQDVDMRMIGELGWPITRAEILEQHLGRSTDEGHSQHRAGPWPPRAPRVRRRARRAGSGFPGRA